MKSLYILFLFITLTPTINGVRNLYKEASASKKNAEILYNKLKNVDENSKDIVLVGYKGASIALKAKFTKGIKNKKKLFKEGVSLLEKQITQKPNDIELRLIRLSIQENTPKILKYQQNITEDKNLIVKNIGHIKNKKKQAYFKDFVSQSKSFTKEEKTVISAL